MISHLMLIELAHLRQQELIAEAVRERLANQVSSNRTMRNPRYIGAALERFVRRCLPANLIVRRSAG
jgi:hypothetical protein